MPRSDFKTCANTKWMTGLKRRGLLLAKETEPVY